MIAHLLQGDLQADSVTSTESAFLVRKWKRKVKITYAVRKKLCDIMKKMIITACRRNHERIYATGHNRYISKTSL